MSTCSTPTLPDPATVWTYGQPGQDSRPARPDHRRQDRPARGGQVHQPPPDGAGRLPAEGLHRPDADGLGRAHGRGHPAPPRRAHRGAVRRDARCSGGPPTARRAPDYVGDTFTYVNDQPASMIWYHDHTMGSTRFKPYLGLAAAYLIFDKVDTGTKIIGQKVPSGYGKYHLPLVLQDKEFNADGSLFYPTVNNGEYPRRDPGPAAPDLGAGVLRRHPGDQRHGLSVPGRPAAPVPAPPAQRLAGPLLQPGVRVRRTTTSRSGSSAPTAGCSPSRRRRPGC